MTNSSYTIYQQDIQLHLKMDIVKEDMPFVDLDQPFSIWWILWSPPWLGWPLWNICVKSDHEYVPLVVSTSRSFPHSWFITGFITRLARRMSLVEQELPTLPDHLSSLPVFSGVRVTRCLVLCVCFVDRGLSFCTFSFWPLCCLFFDIRILITPLVSSNSSWTTMHRYLSAYKQNIARLLMLNLPVE
jgi:hypothetical protein